MHWTVGVEQYTANLSQINILVIKETELLELSLRQLKYHYWSHSIVQRQP